MKISIDTVADSKEDICRAIRLLLSLVGQEPSRNLFDSPGAGLFVNNPVQDQNAASAFGSLFGDDVKQKVGEKQESGVPKVELY